MKILFIAICISGLLYFFFAKRKFDFFSLGFIAAVVYFIPGFYGYTFSPQNYLLSIVLLKETYIVMILVLIGIIIGAILKDYYDNQISSKNEILLSIEGSNYLLNILFLLAASFFLIVLYKQGHYIFQSDKSLILNNISGYMIIFREATALGLILSVLKKKKIYILINTFFMLFLIYIGFRSTAAIAVMSIFVIYLYKKGKQRLIIKNFKTFVFGGFFALFFFIYKGLYQAIKGGNFDLVFQNLRDIQYYTWSIRYSEPFTTQLILNEILRNDFSLEYNHLLGIVYNFLFFSSKLGATHTSFNDQFQNQLFPYVKYGMADNIWAEMWSIGRWPLLILFIIIFVFLLWLGSELLKIRSNNILVIIVLVFSYWSFYLHRNSIVYEMKIIQRVFVVWIICLIISIMLSNILHKKRYFNV